MPSEIRRWDTSAIQQVFQVVKNRDGTYKEFGDTLASVQQKLSDWGGEAGDAFHQELHRQRQNIDQQGSLAPKLAAAIEKAVNDANACRAELQAIDDEAAQHHWLISDGWIVDYSPNPNDEDGALGKLEQRLAALKVKAEAADHELAAAMRAAVGDVPLDGGQPQIPANDGYRPVTAEQLTQIVPGLDPARAAQIVGPLNDVMRQGGMNTPQRQAAFISQVAEESDRFRTFEEYADGSQYNGRTDLGNTQPGDGPRFKGRGAIQVTGRANYTKMSQDLGVDFVNHPELAATPQYAFRTALWYWDTHNGNAVADTGDIVKITRMVNGGTNGLDVRTQFYNKALRVLGR